MLEFFGKNCSPLRLFLCKNSLLLVSNISVLEDLRKLNSGYRIYENPDPDLSIRYLGPCPVHIRPDPKLVLHLYDIEIKLVPS